MKNPMINTQLPAHFVNQSAVFWPGVDFCFFLGLIVFDSVVNISSVNLSTCFPDSSMLVLTTLLDNFWISLEVLLSPLFAIVANSYDSLYRFS